jgi:hypothetical protein
MAGTPAAISPASSASGTPPSSRASHIPMYLPAVATPTAASPARQTPTSARASTSGGNRQTIFNAKELAFTRAQAQGTGSSTYKQQGQQGEQTPRQRWR